MPNYAGQRLGNYRLIRPLGKGGFAEVYLGEHVHLKTYAAIKILEAHLDSAEMEKFLREARIIVRLQHPHIIHLRDFGVENGTPFFAMDYAPNGTLRQRHPSGSILTPSTILPYIIQIAEGLQYAHKTGLIHRDIKPENMLVGQNDEILLSDFGVAIVADSDQQKTRDVSGTTAYMAPEQLQGKPVPASDQYALGIVVYEWLCGDLPFRGSFAEVAIQHLNAEPIPLHEHIPGFPSALEDVVMTALAKDPHNRYPTISDFVDAFDTAIQQPSTSISRRTAFVVIGTGILGAAGIGTAAWFVRHRTATNPHLTPTLPPRITTRPSAQPTSNPTPAGTLFVKYQGHTKPVYSLAWSPDDRLIASGGADTTNPFQVWDATQGNNPIRGQATPIRSIAWSSPTIIASGSEDGIVRIWNINTHAMSSSYPVQNANQPENFVYAVSWSPNGQYIASGGDDGLVQIWDTTKQRFIISYKGHNDIIYAVSWSPDGRYIASGGRDHTVQVWDYTTGTSIATYLGHQYAVFALSWSRNSLHIASGSADGTIHVWDSTTGSNVHLFGNASFNSVNAVTWSPDSAHIVSGIGTTKQNVQVWRIADGKNIYTYAGHSDAVRTVGWSPDGTRIASAGDDTTVQIWKAP